MAKIEEAIERLKMAPTISVDDCSCVLNIGRNAAYEAISRGEIDIFRVGSKSIRVLSAPLRRRLGLESA